MAVSMRLIRQRESDFAKCESLSHFASMIGVTSQFVEDAIAKPKYFTFKVRKKSGGHRLIEDPSDSLKFIQDKLNDYLQAVYFFHRTSACYGFCISHDNEEPRNIISNATRHMGHAHMLNVDFKDFFHQVTTEVVENCFRKFTKVKDHGFIHNLTRLCTYKGRLPMGAPTSPVLSNMAVIDLDHELLQLAKAHGYTYTRYADDLSFSADEAIATSFFEMVSDAIHYTSIKINAQKVKYYDRVDDKIVTGIIVRKETLELPAEYLTQLEKEIKMYKDALVVDYKYQLQSVKSLKIYRQELMGKLNFVGMVYQDHDVVKRLRTLFLEEVDLDFESRSWLDAPYMI